MNTDLDNFSIFNLREVSDDELVQADIRLSESLKDIRIIDKGIGGIFGAIQWFTVVSDSQTYEVRRFERFSWCSCKSIKCCTHIAETLDPLCTSCRERPVRKRGTECSICDMSHSAYLKPTIQKPVERIGRIRI